MSQFKEERSSSTNRLIGADGLRALACLVVMFHHLSQTIQVPRQTAAVQELQSFLLLGNVGVSIFFVLSGYLLSYPFWKQYMHGGEFPSIKQYALRRAARIMPGYYVAFVVAMILVLALNIDAEHFWLRSLAGLTFTSGFHYITFFPSEIDGPLWSISFEVFSYLLMPLFMYGLFRLFRNKRSFPAAMLYWAGVLVVIIAANQAVHAAFTPDEELRGWQYGLIGGAKFWIPNYNPVGFFGHFAIGILASGLVCRLQKSERAAKKLRAAGLFDLLAAGSLLAAAVFLWAMRHEPEFGWSLQNQPFFFPFFTVLIGLFLMAAPLSRWVGGLVDNPFFRYTAKVSFGLYIWHHMIMKLANLYWLKDFQVGGVVRMDRWALLSAGVIVVSYGIASLSYFFIEKPILDRSHHDRSGPGSLRKNKVRKVA
ncbi:acyltransferase [Paenibacillus sp. M1]|uniref:Acyltransferase n=1 Tax=Paenibacillus haidiansis TaxID=1574488 RepID=A0ABU7VUW5_9BACL